MTKTTTGAHRAISHSSWQTTTPKIVKTKHDEITMTDLTSNFPHFNFYYTILILSLSEKDQERIYILKHSEVMITFKVMAFFRKKNSITWLLCSKIHQRSKVDVFLLVQNKNWILPPFFDRFNAQSKNKVEK